MIEPEEYMGDESCAAEAIDDAAQDLGFSEDDTWHAWKLGVEIRSLIESRLKESSDFHGDLRYEQPKVVDAWLEDKEIYAQVSAKGWAENLGFCVHIDIDDNHTDEPANGRPGSICPKCNGTSHLKKGIVKQGYPGDEWEEEVEYYECSCGWSQLEAGSIAKQPISEF